MAKCRNGNWCTCVFPGTFRNEYRRDPERIIPLAFFVRGEPYRLWGLVPSDRHFFGVDTEAYYARYGRDAPAPTFYFLGAGRYGQDLFSRIFYGARVSLFVDCWGFSSRLSWG